MTTTIKSIFAAFTFILFLGTSSSAYAQSDVQALAADENQSLLWKIEGQGIKTSYLFGTIHVLTKEQAQTVFDKHLENILKDVDQVAFEIDMDDPNMAKDMIANVSMRDGQTLTELLGKEDYAKVDAAFTEIMGMSVKPFNNWVPTLVLAPVFQKLVGSATSMEHLILEKAAAKSKEVIGLETVKEQLDILHKFDYQESANSLLESLENPVLLGLGLGTLADYYMSENVELIYTFVTSGFDEGGLGMQDALLASRNKRWVPKMKTFSNENSTLYAVGSGHLGGENGVIELLRAEGFEVTPVLSNK